MSGCGCTMAGLDSFFNSGKTHKGKGEVQVVGRSGSAREGFVLATGSCHGCVLPAAGKRWVVALDKGTSSQVLLQKSVFPLHAMCDVCVPSSSPLQDKALLFSCCWSAAHQEGKGALPFFCGTSVCAVFCIYLWHVSDVACGKKKNPQM